MKTKVCTNCKKRKKIDQFYYNENYANNYKSECKKCQSKKSAERYLERRGEKRCKNCDTIIGLQKQYCDNCAYQSGLKLKRIYQRKQRQKLYFRKKEAKRKKIWYQNNLTS